MPALTAGGSVSFNNSSRLAYSSGACVVSPVMLPPGRARLATSPVRTGSCTSIMTTGVVGKASLCGEALDITGRDDDIDSAPAEVLDEFLDTFVAPAREAALDGDGPAFDVAELPQLIKKLGPDRIGLAGIRPCRKQTDRRYRLGGDDAW